MSLYALIRKDSEYAHQSSGKPFPVTLDDKQSRGGGMVVIGGPGGCYRLSDVVFYEKPVTNLYYNFGDGFVRGEELALVLMDGQVSTGDCPGFFRS